MVKWARIWLDINVLLKFQTIYFTFSLGVSVWLDQKCFCRVAQKSSLPLLLCSIHIQSVFKNKITYFLHGFLRHIHYVCEPLNSSIVLASGRLLKASMEIKHTMLILYKIYANCQHFIKSLSTFGTFVCGAKRIGWHCEVPFSGKGPRTWL